GSHCYFFINIVIFHVNTWLYWYKQSAGDILTLIAMLQKSISPNYGPEISASKFIVTSNEHSSNLTIFTTVHEDEGMYHCAQMDRLKSICNLFGNSIQCLILIFFVVQQTTVSVISQPTISEPTGSETLQCSVLSDSENTTCSGEPSVFWFRSRSEKYFPDMIYTEGKKAENCEKRSDSPKRCFYNFSKNISSSDTGTYYCAVATCGQIIFGNEINRRNGMTLHTSFEVFKINDKLCLFFLAGPDMNYAALHFSEGRASQGKKTRELMTECVYSQVKGST
uniref:Ig-like domain-containing protein n=1 Tax=Poecilia mexicana TaxID=48701 RepID=A0A3B3YKU6_9TELE